MRKKLSIINGFKISEKMKEKYVKLSEEELERKYKKRFFRLEGLHKSIFDYKFELMSDELNDYLEIRDPEYIDNKEFPNKRRNVGCYSYHLYDSVDDRFGRLNVYMERTSTKKEQYKENMAIYLSLIYNGKISCEKEFEDVVDIIKNELKFEECLF